MPLSVVRRPALQRCRSARWIGTAKILIGWPSTT